MAKVLCVLYDDPVDGYPQSYARDEIPAVKSYPGGQTAPTPKQIDFKPGQLLGSVSGELGLRKFLEGLGHTFIVTADKEGPELGLRTRTSRRRNRHLATVLASLPDGGKDRKGQEAQACHHRRYRFRSRRSSSCHQARRHRRGGYLQQQHQRVRARGDDDPLAGA